MSGARVLDEQQRRIDELIAALAALDNKHARDIAQALLQVVLDLHASGLARLAEIVTEADGADGPIVARLMQDKQVSALLLLHGLHPQDLASRVRHAVEGLRAPLGAQGMGIELLEAREDLVRVRLAGVLTGKHVTPADVQNDIERAIFEQAPDVAHIEIDGMPDVNVHELRFVATLPTS
ncbi:NifU family protein [Caballeronia sp. SEWSISQ10-4 2]|uniref:NifU family protein n=1 Tax=Caballeronia sp. SEWSISQ10-4 2 TaxID=2937438 RepID=UPI0026557211|nr:NifU family protein [Caballeronia sp. SEWSISQ10-4 2]MDN7179860.1 NifU family protein [Caballeronia sp. SEWSISQ10-4 2]